MAPRFAARPARLVPRPPTDRTTPVDRPAARSSGRANPSTNPPVHRTPVESRTAAAPRGSTARQGSTEERALLASEPSGPGRSSPAGRWDLGRRPVARPSVQLASRASAAVELPAGAAQTTAPTAAAPLAPVLPVLVVLQVFAVLPAAPMSRAHVVLPAAVSQGLPGSQVSAYWAVLRESRGRTVRPTTVSRQVPAVPVVGAAGAGARARHRRVEVAECRWAPLPERLRRCLLPLCLIRRIRIRQPCLTPPWSQANVGRIPAPTLRDPGN